MRYIRYKRQILRYQHDVFRFARHLLGTIDDAQDVTQDVLIKFWDHFDEIDSKKIKSWLMTTTHHQCIDVIRRRKSDFSLDESLQLRGAETPDEQYDREEQLQMVEQSLAALPETLRAPVILRDIEGYSYKEIADILKQPQNTVSVCIHRGRRILRDKLRTVYTLEEK